MTTQTTSPVPPAGVTTTQPTIITDLGGRSDQDFTLPGELIPTFININGIPVVMRGNMQWGYTSGVGPQRARFTLIRSNVNEIVKAVNDTANRMVTLTYGVPGVSGTQQSAPTVFTKLALMPVEAGDFNFDTLVIADQRWRWERVIVHQTFNVTRAVTDKFVYGGRTISAGASIPLAEAPKFFAGWSIKPEGGGQAARPWTALDICIEILKRWLGYDDTDIVIDPLIKPTAYTPMNQRILGEPADIVLSRYLKLAGADIYIGADGRINIYNAVVPAPPSEQQSYWVRIAPFLTSGALKRLNKAPIRPVSVATGFEREREVVLVYQEGAEVSSDPTMQPAKTYSQAKLQLIRGTVYMENVTRTVVDNQVPGFPRGSIVTIEQALTAFGTRFGVPGATITMETLRRLYGTLSVTSSTVSRALKDATGALFNPIAVTAWQGIMNDYRKLFRIPRVTMDLIKDLHPLLCDVIFEDTGTRAPAEVFTRLTWIISAIARDPNVSSTGCFLNSFATTPAQPAPAYVAGIDHGLGLVQLDFRDDLSRPGFVNDVIPGELAGQSKNQMLKDAFQINEVGTSAFAYSQIYGVSENWTMLAVVSLIEQPQPGAPGIEWEYADPPKTPVDLTGSGAYGPTVNLMSRADTARIPLQPNNIFYSRLKNTQTNAPGFVNQRIMQSIAAQNGIITYYRFADQLQGGASFEMNSTTLQLRPTANIPEVRHTINDGGVCTVILSAPGQALPIPLYNLLPGDVLAVVERQVSASRVEQGGGQGG